MLKEDAFWHLKSSLKALVSHLNLKNSYSSSSVNTQARTPIIAMTRSFSEAMSHSNGERIL